MGATSKELVTGYNYWGTYAEIIALGRVDVLYNIYNGDTLIWEGPIDRSSANGAGYTDITTSIGVISFYWGDPTQAIDTILAALEIDLGGGPVAVPMSAMRNVCYAVCYDMAFGGQTTAPTLTYDIQRWTRAFPELDDVAHDVDGDALIPEAIYELLTDSFVGAGIATTHVDKPSFLAACETLIDEEIGASPDIDQTQSVRELVGQLLNYIDGFIYFDAGKLKMGLVRPASTVGLDVIDESDLLEEPRPLNSQFDGTWNKTILTFRDRDNNWEETTEEYDDPANAAIVGQTVRKTVNLPWVTKRDVAKKLAKLFGIKGGLPTIVWELTLKPEWKTLKPGDRFKLTYAAFGISERVVRVKSVTRGKASAPDISVTVQEEQARSTTGDYVPGTDTFDIPVTVGPDGTDSFDLVSATPRLSWLPTALKDSKDDGLLVALDRPTINTTGSDIYFTWDPAQAEYRRIGNQTSFPAKAEIISWHRYRTNNWLLRLEIANEWDYDRVQTLIDEALELFIVVGQRLIKTVGTPKNQHQVTAPWFKVVAGGRMELHSATVLDIEVDNAAFGTDDIELETTADDGRHPTIHVYVGRPEDFAILPHNAIQFDRNAGNSLDDTGLVRHIKTPVRNHKQAQDLADVTATTFDRNLTTMCPSGTYSRDWGAAAPSSYEMFDEQGYLEAIFQPGADYPHVEAIDEALGLFYNGVPSAEQIRLIEHIDDVLGWMVGGAGRLNYGES